MTEPDHNSSRLPGAQIFIHPDHLAGKLNFPKPKKPFNRPRATAIFLLVFVVVLAFAATVYFPRSRAASFAVNTKEAVGESSDKTHQIDQSLQFLYEDLTNQTRQDAVVSDTKSTSSSQINNQIFDTSIMLLNQAKLVVEKASVKGFSVPADDPNKASREERALADQIDKEVSDFTATSSKLDKLTQEEASDQTQDLQTSVKALKTSVDKYVTEAQKTADYYTQISDSSIALTNLANSTLTLADIPNTIKQLQNFSAKFSENKNLPEQISAYNQDVVTVFNLLVVFYQGLAQQGLNSDTFTPSYDLFMARLQSVSAKSQSDEISFWQSNQALTSVDFLQNQHTKLLEDSQKVLAANNFFLLSWVGIK